MIAKLLTGLFLLRTAQTQLFGNEDIRCLESNNSMYYSGRCYPLLARGPCEDGYWLVLQSATIIQDSATLEAACAPCQCCKESTRKVYWPADGQCYKSSDPVVCRPGNRLVNDFDGTGTCECKDGFTRVRAGGNDDETCFPLYRRPPSCKQDEYLVPSGDPGWGHCARNPCGVDGAALWQNGQCYMLGTAGPCPEQDQLFRVSDDGQPACLSPGFSSFDKVPQRCRESCVLQFNQNSPSGSSGGRQPAISSKLQAFLKRKRIQEPPAEFGPQTDMWAWGD